MPNTRLENKESTNGLRPSLIDQFNEALRGCQMSARGFFYALLPLFERSKPYGLIEMDAEQLSAYFHVSAHHTRRYLYELKRKNILRVGVDGTLICPILIRTQFKIRDVA
jgi:hypothetical protein